MGPVRRFRRAATAKATVAMLAVGLAGTVGCVRIDGGSVEFSWVLRTADGRAIGDCGCSNPPVANVRLNLRLVSAAGTDEGAMPCAGRTQCQFSCPRQTGATPFDIPETKPDQMYLISIDALAADGTALSAIKTPPPVARSVVRGQPTDMGALLLVTECADACSGVNGQGVCARP
jgi:hypothetical protein